MSFSTESSRRATRLGISLALAAMLTFVLASAAAASVGPVLEVQSVANTTAAPGGTLDYFIDVSNVGDESTSGELTLTATLPTGLTAVSAENNGASPEWGGCVLGSSTVTCTQSEPQGPGGSRNTNLRITAEVAPDASGVLTSSFTVSGGGAAEASTVDPTRISSTAPGFGVDSFDAQLASDRAGDPYTQAGGHPYALSTSILFNTLTNPNPALGENWPVEQAKDIDVELPPGLVADPTATGEARCTPAQLAVGTITTSDTLCPAGSQVGTASVFTTKGLKFGPTIPVYNLVPPAGVPARFGYNLDGTIVTLDGGVRADGGYNLSASVHNVTDGLAIAGTRLTLWGVPADPSHNAERSCPGEAPVWGGLGPSCSTEAPLRPFLRDPTSCTAPGTGLTTTLSVDSWSHPGVFTEASTTTHELPAFPALPSEWGAPVGVTGCDTVPFSPSLSVSADEPAAGSPSGYKFDIGLPQSNDPTVTGEADMKKIVTTLPEGVQLSPSSANGLGACSESQVGFVSGGNPEPNPLHFNEEAPSCPENSKIGEVEITTPLLEEPLKGAAYLATPNANPFGSLLAMYLVVKGPGVLVKLPGEVHADPFTGRVTATFDHNPQLPVSKVELLLKGGSRAPLMNPPSCGTFMTESAFSSWAQPEAPVALSSPEQISTNANGEACAAPGFGPSFTGGTTSTKAGGFSPLVLSFSRSDTDQRFKGLAATLPPGVAAVLAGVPLCSDAQAAGATCPPASQIGTVTVGAGPGPHPYFLKGQVFLTGPYNGGPYGFAVVVDAVAGPFDLGNVVVRGSIRVDPHTGQATVASDPFPQFVNQTGIPTDVRRVDVTVDRPSFTFNPTDCAPLQLTSTLSSVGGTSAPVAEHFQAGECSKLKFQPSFKVSTSAKTSRVNGASLDVKLAYPSGSFGTQANIAKVKVDLPKQLPSRLKTLQQACPASTFDANPAACPPNSRVGSATAVTPILATPLTGPAYFVSHGGQAFPDLTIVLQSEGVTVDLVGTTFINEKTSVTSSTFEQVPDVPVSSFELKLPQGPFSAVAAHGNLCASKLVMPTSFVAQNGATLRQSTPISVSGCKPTVTVVRHSAHGSRATVVASVPFAGRLVASGTGLVRVAKRVARAGNATLGLSLSIGETRFLARHPGRKLRVRVKLAFTYARGAPISAAVTLLLG